jgi:hypothetical protein
MNKEKELGLQLTLESTFKRDPKELKEEVAPCPLKGGKQNQASK